MNNIKTKKIIAAFMATVVLFTIFIPVTSSATVYKNLRYNTAPEFKVNVSKDKKVYVTVRDGGSLNVTSIKIYAIKNNKKINLITNRGAQCINNTNKTNRNYLISNEYVKEKMNRFYLIALDKSGNKLQTYFYIRKLDDGSFKLNYAPWVNSFGLGNDRVQFNISNGAHIKKILIYDLNDNNRKVAEGTDTPATVRIKLDYANRLKANKNGIYRIKIYTEDYQSQSAVREMIFKVDTATR